MKAKKTLISFFILSLFSAPLFANNILVENVSLEGQVASGDYVYVEFDLSWDNSWRTVSVPGNWDAAWVFIKYSVAGGEWHHATLDTVDFTAPYSTTVKVASDSVGAFIYRSSNGSGSVNMDNIRLRWEYGVDGVADDAYLDVKVFAMEMVYIPEGAFYIGDGATVLGRFQDETTEQPFQVTSEGAITLGPNPGELDLYGESFSGTSMAADYPKGYHAFYCLKYEVSQEQYAEFLNTLTRAQQETRTYQTLSTITDSTYVMTANNNLNWRNGIWCDTPPAEPEPVEFSCYLSPSPNEDGDGESLPVLNLTWMDVAAYLDWAGLRPMTELEYEKICRGPNYPVTNEYAWGTTNLHSTLYTLNNKGLPNEGITDPGSATGNAAYYPSTVTSKVVRCGIFAASAANTRQETGASYYGVMEMAGNVDEMVVSAQTLSGRSYTGVHGDGTLMPTGDANEDYWPGINGHSSWYSANSAFGGTTGVTAAAGAGTKGGNTMSGNTINRMEISARGDNTRMAISTSRLLPYGIRGVRTAD